MKYSTFMAGGLVLVLSACAEGQRKSGDGMTATGSDTVIAVTIEAGKIVAPDVTRSSIDHGAIRWTISTAGNYTFPRDGIVIDPGHFNCFQNHIGSTFKCLKRGHKSGGQFKYIVNVNEGATSLPALDPWIYND